MILSASILSADFAALGHDVTAMDAAGADWIHIDAFDGHFVPNLTIGPAVIAAIRPHTQKPLDVHYMANNPDQYIEATAKAGATYMTVHLEACQNPAKTIAAIKSAGMKAGLACMLDTPAEALKPYLAELDQVLVMTVKGGFGGDPFREDMLPKIKQLRQWIDTLPKEQQPLLSVDGGVSTTTAPLLAAAGAQVLCAGSALFGKPRMPTAYKNNIQHLRNAAG